MINLLPPETKDSYRYARRNRHLLHWVVSLSAAITGALVLTAFGVFYLHMNSENYDRQTTLIKKDLEEKKLGETEKKVAEMSNNLQLALQVLSKQIVFSDLINRLSALTPRNTVLTGLTISQIQSSLDITAQAVDYNAATQLQINLADEGNQVFSKADIIGIACASQNTPGSTDSKSTYPCTVSIRALMSPDSPFMFIHTKKSTQTERSRP